MPVQYCSTVQAACIVEFASLETPLHPPPPHPANCYHSVYSVFYHFLGNLLRQLCFAACLKKSFIQYLPSVSYSVFDCFIFPLFFGLCQHAIRRKQILLLPKQTLTIATSPNANIKTNQFTGSKHIRMRL